jgi:flagellin
MSLRVNTNISAINTHRAMQMNDLNLSKSLEKLSSGLRINRASDDAAGLSISETLRGQVRGLAQAEKNAQDGISLINTAEGALNEIHSILQRMRELAVQSSNGTLTTSDHLATDAEFQSLISEIDNITSYTSFNTQPLLNDPAGTSPITFTFQVGANQGQTLTVAIQSVSSTALTLTSGGTSIVATTTQQSSMDAITYLDSAIAAVSGVRSALGAISNRLEHTINNVSASRENLSAAESRIRDVDMADEMSTLTRNQILMQSSTAMLAQANAQPQSVLSLFK